MYSAAQKRERRETRAPQEAPAGDEMGEESIHSRQKPFEKKKKSGGELSEQ